MMSKSYKADLLEALRDPSEAAEYLDAALEDGDEDVFRLALKDVLEAQKYLSQLPEKAKFNQDNVSSVFYQPPSSELCHFDSFLHALGFRLAIQRCK
jgi:DNA-binding phage protein